MKQLQLVKKQPSLTWAEVSAGGTVTSFLSVLAQSFEVALSELGVCEVVSVRPERDTAQLGVPGQSPEGGARPAPPVSAVRDGCRRVLGPRNVLIS